jgi:hypothetical protein
MDGGEKMEHIMTILNLKNSPVIENFTAEMQTWLMTYNDGDTQIVWVTFYNEKDTLSCIIEGYTPDIKEFEVDSIEFDTEKGLLYIREIDIFQEKAQYAYVFELPENDIQEILKLFEEEATPA